MKQLLRFLIFAFIWLSPIISLGQNQYIFSNRIFNIQFLYNYHSPSGDFSKTFGNFNSIGFGGLFKSKNNWVLGVELNYLFGKEVKTNSILNNLGSSGGYLSSTFGDPGNFSVGMNGWAGFIKGGRVIGLSKRNMNSGILLTAGIGFLQHKVKLTSHDGNIPSLDKNYVRGYDRFSNGIAFSEFVGYSYQSRNRLVNFYFGLELIQAKTYNRRGYNYDQMAEDKGLKTDLSTSLRFGWMIPIYLNTKEQDEFQFR